MLVGLGIGYAYWLLGRLVSEKNLVQSADAGSAIFLHKNFYYLVPAKVYLEKELFKLVPVKPCPHGFIENWSDECPDCRH